MGRNKPQPKPQHRRPPASFGRPPSSALAGFESLEDRLVMSIDLPNWLDLNFVETYRAGGFSKLDSKLAFVAYEDTVGNAEQRDAAVTQLSTVGFVNGDKIGVQVTSSQTVGALRNQLAGLGFEETGATSSAVAGWIDKSKVDDLAGIATVQKASLSYRPITNQTVGTQGSVSMRADVARATYGVDGTGSKIGVISDSFNTSGNGNYALDISLGALPPGVQVLQDSLTPEGDEGRAMMQLIHAVAPGAGLAFYSGFLPGVSDQPMANAINALAAANSGIIVDDLGYLNAPFFQDGFAAQAVDTAFANGVAYFSAAGNQADDSYQAPYRNSNQNFFYQGFNFGPKHNFATSGTDTTQSITIAPGGEFVVSFQWDQPFGTVSSASGGSQSDYDIFLLDSGGNVVAASFDDNIGGDPLEIMGYRNTSATAKNYDVVITKFAGSNAGTLKYIDFGGGVTVNQFDTKSSTLFGHPNASGAAAVGAAYWDDTPAFGQNPPQLEDFSSKGGTPIIFDLAGNRLTTPVTRNQPRVVGPDGIETTFFPTQANPFFFGTSAAAPNVAAVAALMRDADPNITPTNIYTKLQDTAIGMPSTGFNFNAGFGLVQADKAVAAVAPSFTLTQTNDLDLITTNHIVTVTLLDTNGAPIANQPLTVRTLPGSAHTVVLTPVGSGSTDANGQAQFQYTANTVGVDFIQAFTTTGNTLQSNVLTKTWTVTSNLAMTQPTTINAVGSNHVVTVTATDSLGRLIEDQPITVQTLAGSAHFPVTLTPVSTGITDANGQAQFFYTVNTSGVDQLRATTTTIGPPINSNVLTKTWTVTTNLALSQVDSIDAVGGEHIVTVVATDGVGNLVSNQSVNVQTLAGSANFPVSLTPIGNGSTDANGRAQFRYTGAVAGLDSIQATTTLGPVVNSNILQKTWRITATLNLSQINNINLVNTQHVVTVTALDPNGLPVPNQGITIQTLTGSAHFPVTLTPVTTNLTDANGQAQFFYTASTQGRDLLQASTTFGPSVNSNTLTKFWTETASLIISQDLDLNLTGTQHVITVTALGANGLPVANQLISALTLAGSDHFPVTLSPVGSNLTNSSGQAQFTYTVLTEGIDQIQAYVNISGTQVVSSNVLTKYWSVPGSITGVAFIDKNGNGIPEPDDIGLPNVAFLLTGVDPLGRPVNQTTASDSFGRYSFTNLVTGVGGLGSNYTLTQLQPAAYVPGAITAGLAGGVIVPPLFEITNIVLTSGATASGYNFAQAGLRPEFISKRLFLSSAENYVVPGNITSPDQTTMAALGAIPAPVNTVRSGIDIILNGGYPAPREDLAPQANNQQQVLANGSNPTQTNVNNANSQLASSSRSRGQRT